MASHKRKAASGPSLHAGTFDAIIGTIASVKPKLADLSRKDVRVALLGDLQRLAVLGETLSDQRQRSKIAADVADKLDREGVHLWNVSRLVRQETGTDEDRTLLAALRLAGFRLIEAGIEQKPSVETLSNVLQLASKTGMALSESGRNDVAGSVLGSAAKASFSCAGIFQFEEQLQNAEDVDNGAHDQTRARAVILYYCSRMLAAWRDGNDAIAQFMLEKITGAALAMAFLFIRYSAVIVPFTESDEKRLSLVAITDRELLASKIMEIGKSILRASARVQGESSAGLVDAKRALDAIKWLQKAFTLVEKMEDSESAGVSEVKRSILRSLVRAYHLSSSIEAENLLRAETTLQELITSVDSNTNKTNPELHQLRWMRLAVLRKRQAPESAILEAFVSIVDHAEFTESVTAEILQELRTMTQQHKLVSDVLLRCILQILDAPPENVIFIDRFLLALISHCARDQDVSRAIKDVETACSCENRSLSSASADFEFGLFLQVLSQSEFELPKTPTMACLTILWKVGDRHFQMKKWSEAAEWFLVGTHKAFASVAQMSGPKSLRKAALCYIEQREYARASQVIRRCPDDQSSTFYLRFLAAAYQGLEDDAVAAIQNMASAPDFDKKMLLLATQLSHESDLKIVLLTCLEALLKTLQSRGPIDSDVEAICLARCIIRLVMRLMKETPVETERVALASSLVRHFKTASALVRTAVTGKNAPLIAKDASWLWRTAYNSAQGFTEWRDAEIQIGDLFELSYELAHAYSQIAVANTETDVYVHMAFSAFSSVAARMYTLHSMQDNGDKPRQQTTVLQDIQRAKDAIASVKERYRSSTQLDSENLEELLHSIHVFEAELFYQRREWDKLLGVINEIGIGSTTLTSYEAIADMLWSESDCPVHVLYAALEALLHSCLDRGKLSIEKFSRWLRAICSILLSRNFYADRTKAIGYVEQALTVLEDQNNSAESGEDVYPMDERHWLLSTSYNTGIECLAASNLDEAKRWFEVATVVCRSVPDGVRHAERISETYRRLLDQYAPQTI
ncbi:uncharacterized protein FOMMEDRAFT_146421 [Fomitiporia mediterranea MF3/22]|uniref:uncharacterized protein n=1 Tax=Fomitiporia mediterranea (strain MF3/22) TaxID=694068 RepID=UPI0004409656|nr:uncharacterized protein FOMMEDRAFT_146421 [Fomitiporia mediterranea MF3/22]EJD04521.1 hypothetical protein FOMMEDRAFT_146421 [Fomitiporia mediterranea MF3/22]